ncbi:MAG TPA: DUF1376 domain-containing protein [Roseiarcus sp.]|jgi:uncharacterized protein YdaU (DUF1376 family)|nr:DUF1376 domain-containing protein [Roseiarcus sp.]
MNGATEDSPALPWLPLYPDRFLADVNGMNAAERGAYISLLVVYWRDGSLPGDDDDMLRRYAGMDPREWRRSRPIVQARFSPDWRHAKLDEEREKAADIYKRKVEGGREMQRRRAALKLVSDSGS